MSDIHHILGIYIYHCIFTPPVGRARLRKSPFERVAGQKSVFLTCSSGKLCYFALALYVDNLSGKTSSTTSINNISQNERGRSRSTCQTLLTTPAHLYKYRVDACQKRICELRSTPMPALCVQAQRQLITTLANFWDETAQRCAGLPPASTLAPLVV